MLIDPDLEQVDLEEVAFVLQEHVGTADGEPLVWESPLLIGTTSVVMRVVAEAEDGSTSLTMACVVHEFDPDRLDILDVASPLDDWYVLFADAQNVEEPADWLALVGSCPLAEGASGIQRCLEAAALVFRTLAEAGVIRAINVLDVDADVGRRCAVLEEMKTNRARETMDLALDLADRCRTVGDFVFAAWLDLAAAEVADELGEMTTCWDLASRSWDALGRSMKNELAVGGYAMALVNTGRSDDALALLAEGLRGADDPEARAYLRGAQGVVLARCGRLPEAIDAMRDAVDDPAVDPAVARKLRRQLTEARRLVGGREPSPIDSGDLLDEVDAALNDLSARLARCWQLGDFGDEVGRIEQVTADLRRQWADLGTNQRVRLLLVEGTVSLSHGQPLAALRHVRQASLLATQAGHADLARSVQMLGASMGIGYELPAGLLEEASPIERLMYYANVTYYGLVAAAAGAHEAGAIEPLLVPALKAVRVVDENRHAFDSVSDRSGWAALGARAYELALTVASTLGDRELVVELLERIRAQGVPESTAEASSASLRAIARSLDELDVVNPRIATITGASRIVPGADTIPLAEVVARIGGGDAWWWRCHSFGDRLHWAVRAPDGTVSIGHNLLALHRGDGPEFAGLADLFSAPTRRAETPDHLLVEDRGDRLDPTLRRLAADILPPVVADAARVAAGLGRPIRLVWAPPPSLGTVPIGLLPLDDRYRLLHGAIVTTAPPTSLVSSTPPRPRARERIHETVVLGEGDDLRFGAHIVGPDGLGASVERVAGSWAHTSAKPSLAGRLATPEAVVQLWANPSPALTLYYGHVDGSWPGAPLRASLRLSGPASGSPPAPLEVRRLLIGAPAGAPEVVVLCACSSLETKAIGSGEWWGPGTALLWQGARQVVGSLWNLLDCPATARFTVELTSRLRSRDDPAVVLHRLQVEWSDAWERRIGNRYSETAEDRHPILWAGWSVTGLAGR